MSCCRANETEDVTFYKKLDEVARAIAADPERFKADLLHPVKGTKLASLKAAVSKVYSE